MSAVTPWHTCLVEGRPSRKWMISTEESRQNQRKLDVHDELV